jgi:3,4-dihydroxy 2-butanone 4-phosphate synthase/GTP cyclohydrolase II
MKSSVEIAIQALRQGKMIVLTDDAARENEGDLVFPAENITPEIMNFMIRHGTGIVCVALKKSQLESLGLSLLVPPSENTTKQRTPFIMPVDAAQGITTGVSAADRVKTIQVMMDPQSNAQDLTKPGHLYPLQAAEGGVLVRAGHTEGSVDLMHLAGFKPAAVICEVMNPDGTMACGEALKTFASAHDLYSLSIEDLIAYRCRDADALCEMTSAQLPLKNYGEFEVFVFKEKYSYKEHLALYKKPRKNSHALVRLHSCCATGDIFGSLRCDCQGQLQFALTKIAAEGGLLLYLDQEGRDIGLFNKIKSYALQEKGFDTVEANQCLGFPLDNRDYLVAANILHSLSMTSVYLMTNNPLKISALRQYGIEVIQRIPVPSMANAYNRVYLNTKKTKLNHFLEEFL